MSTNWDDLRFFLTLVRTQKASAAARQLGVSHPTVTRRIKALEDAVGARLFDSASGPLCSHSRRGKAVGGC
jgi:DNA-binding transcriptional LysR family regulator